MSALKRLTERQRQFVLAYVSGPDGVRGIGRAAMRAAGYKGKPKSLDEMASHLLKQINVAAAVEELRAGAEQKALRRLREWGDLVPLAQRALVRAARRGGKNAASMVSAAREILDRALGKVPAQVKHSGTVGVEHYLKAAMPEEGDA